MAKKDKINGFNALYEALKEKEIKLKKEEVKTVVNTIKELIIECGTEKAIDFSKFVKFENVVSSGKIRPKARFRRDVLVALNGEKASSNDENDDEGEE